MSEQRTVRVRIAIALDEHGEWHAADRMTDAADALQWMRGIVQFWWVEADVPLPVPPAVIQGTVTPAEERVTYDANPRN